MGKPHVWVKDEYGDPEYIDGFNHGGPKCARCGKWECEHCDPGFLTEDCDIQPEDVLFYTEEVPPSGSSSQEPPG